MKFPLGSTKADLPAREELFYWAPWVLVVVEALLEDDIWDYVVEYGAVVEEVVDPTPSLTPLP